MVVGLIRPNSRRTNYGTSLTRSAIEPPHWMACRAHQLRVQGHDVRVWDMQVHLSTIISMVDCDEIEIWPTGVHPSAFIQERAGVEAVIAKFPDHPQVKIVEKLPFANACSASPDWADFDLGAYRCHNWQGWGWPDRSGYGTLHTSASCPHSCDFCTIHEYYGHKFKRRSVDAILEDIVGLMDEDVVHVKVMDELFIRRDKPFRQLIEAIEANGLTGLNIWGYGRIDSIPVDLLPQMKRIGVNWICLGIESANPDTRAAMNKGGVTNPQIIDIVRSIQDAGIAVLGNFMVGFPDEDARDIAATTEFAIHLGCEYSNIYCVTPYPGTPLRDLAEAQGWDVPVAPMEYAQHSYDFKPIPTRHLPAIGVLALKDEAWHHIHTRPEYTNMILSRFGIAAVGSTVEMTSNPIARRIFDGGTYRSYTS